jgi:hypothetical protein
MSLTSGKEHFATLGLPPVRLSDSFADVDSLAPAPAWRTKLSKQAGVAVSNGARLDPTAQAWYPDGDPRKDDFVLKMLTVCGPPTDATLTALPPLLSAQFTAAGNQTPASANRVPLSATFAKPASLAVLTFLTESGLTESGPSTTQPCIMVTGPCITTRAPLSANDIPPLAKQALAPYFTIRDPNTLSPTSREAVDNYHPMVVSMVADSREWTQKEAAEVLATDKGGESLLFSMEAHKANRSVVVLSSYPTRRDATDPFAPLWKSSAFPDPAAPTFDPGEPTPTVDIGCDISHVDQGGWTHNGSLLLPEIHNMPIGFCAKIDAHLSRESFVTALASFTGLPESEYDFLNNDFTDSWFEGVRKNPASLG